MLFVCHFNTYTADPSKLYRDNTLLQHVASLHKLPDFTYHDILNDVRLIDVLWFNKTRFPYPQYAFEIVDSIGTLPGAFARCSQLSNFRTKFFIVAPESHRDKYYQTLEKRVYQPMKDFFQFKSYEEIKKTYDVLVEKSNQIEWLR